NPVKVILPGGEEPKPAPAPAPKEAPAKPQGSAQLPAGRPPEANEEFQVRADGTQLADPQKDKEKAKDQRPGRADAPITITAFGNRLIITSDDPAALALVQELVRLLTQTPGGE